jgi:hypothetical protein
MILRMSGRRLAEATTRAERGGSVGTDPRKSEVVRTSRFNAEDAEFGQEDAEELSRLLTAYPYQVIRT